jgi:hypothetical protein
VSEEETMYVNTYVLEKLVSVWLSERRAEAARVAAVEAATAEPESPRPAKATKSGRAPRWIALQLGR